MTLARSMPAIAALGAAVVVATLVLVPLPAAAGLLTIGVAVVGVAILRAAVHELTAGPRLRALALGSGALLTGVAGAAGGVSVLIDPDYEVDGVPLSAEIYLVSLVLVTLLMVPGLLRPQQRHDSLARLRVGLDTVGVASSLMFPPWLLMFSYGDPPGASVLAVMLGASATAVAAVAGVHSVRHRAALQWCGPAVALLLICLTALVVAADNPENSNSTIAGVAAAAAINIAAGMLWWGTVRVRPDAGPLPPVGSEPAAGFPLFALPVLGSAVAIAVQLMHGRGFDGMSIALGTTTVLAVAAREFVAAIALRRHADHLTDQGNRLRSLMFGSSDVAMVLDTGLAVRWQSPAAARHFGLSDQDVLSRPVSALVHPDQADAVEEFLATRMGDITDPADARCLPVRLRDGFGRWRETEWTAGGDDPAQPGRTLVLHIRDVSDRRELEQALRQAAHLDPVTGLANRIGLARAGSPMPDAGALIVLELGGLTAIADVHGGELAEVVMVEAGRRLRTRVAAADIPARIGDTRLAVLTHGGAVRAHVLASQLVTVLTAPYEVAGADAHLAVWAGLSDLVVGTDVEEVLRRAELALRAVRSGPPGVVEWYDEEMEARLLRRSTLEQDLPGAIARNELELRYQPVIELPGDRPVGVEAVLSWRHPALGRVAATELLPLAEDLGFLGEVRTWVLHRACAHLASWRRQRDGLWLSIHVRPRELVGAAFQAGLDNAIETHQVPESALVIEITEDDLQPGPQGTETDVAGHLGRLRMRGIRIAVGHFGAGPTSLSRLRVLPVDLLKVDREVFGQPLDASRPPGPVLHGETGCGVAQPPPGRTPESPTSNTGMRAIPAHTQTTPGPRLAPAPHAKQALVAIMDVTVMLGRRLGLDVIAHGLESAADLETVRAAGCRLGQGDLLGRDMPAERFEALLDRHHDRPAPTPGAGR